MAEKEFKEVQGEGEGTGLEGVSPSLGHCNNIPHKQQKFIAHSPGSWEQGQGADRFCV